MHKEAEAPVRRAFSQQSDPAQAIDEIARSLECDDLAGMIFFCSDAYDPSEISEQLQARFSCPVVGCTTAGEIGEVYQRGGIVAVGFSSEDFRMHVAPITDLGSFDATSAQKLAERLHDDVAGGELDRERMFGLILLDGLSGCEEPVTALVQEVLGGVGLFGGSAGDNLRFEQTRVYFDGAFHTGAGVLVLLDTSLPFEIFQLQHFEPSEDDLVITEADPSIRRVTEIDGGEAAEEYARLLEVDVDQLDPQIFARYPVMLQIGDEWYVRSIQRVNDDGSMDFFCAIDEGLPLTIARGVGFVPTLQAKVDELVKKFGSIACTIGCDCVLRRLEIEQTGVQTEVENVLEPLKFVGFSTFGEQFGAIHVNQTLTGVVIGNRAA